MIDPLIYILAPFGLAFALFVLYLIVALFLRDPARPFRMFKAPPLEGGPETRSLVPEEGKGKEEDQKTG